MFAAHKKESKRVFIASNFLKTEISFLLVAVLSLNYTILQFDCREWEAGTVWNQLDNVLSCSYGSGGDMISKNQ